MTDGKANILLWDIETSDLKADFGHILSIGWKWYGESRVYVSSLKDMYAWPQAGKTLWDDKEIVREFVKEVYSEADISITWYGKRFDVPFVRSRMLYWKLPNSMPPVSQIDLWETCRSELCISSNRLANFGSFAQLEEGKLFMPVSDWKRAAQGSIPHMNKTVKRVKSDVLLLEEAYERLRPYIRVNRPNIGQVVDRVRVCPACGSRAVHKRGYRITLANRHQRWQCQDCGAWSSSPQTNDKLR